VETGRDFGAFPKNVRSRDAGFGCGCVCDVHQTTNRWFTLSFFFIF
jgi:hypothetical protein